MRHATPDDHPGTDGPSLSRAVLVRRALAAAGVVGGGAAVALVADEAGTAPSPDRDLRILRFLLGLEQVQQQFYEQAVAAAALNGELRRFADIVARHEREHVRTLEQVVGPSSSPPTVRPGDAIRDPQAFAATALTLEEATAAAYIGQGAHLTTERITTAARIVSVEARHAAWIRDILGRLPAPDAADPALRPAQATDRIERLGIVE